MPFLDGESRESRRARLRRGLPRVELDPDAQLFLNDYGVEGLGPKSDGLYALVAGLKQQGVPIDGVGFQMHTGGLFGTPAKASVQANIQRFVQLGLAVRITEMDVQVGLTASGDGSRGQARSAATDLS